MQNLQRGGGAAKIAGGVIALVILALTLTACGDDFGTECSLPDNDAVRQACSGTSASTGEEEEVEANTSATASCVVENIIECDSRICAKYRGSKPFCTERCSSPTDSSCPDGAFCAEYVVGTGKHYCVKSSLRNY
jgi:hypothetical protein